LVLRGDPPSGVNYDHSKDYFQFAEDLVKYIRVSLIKNKNLNQIIILED